MPLHRIGLGEIAPFRWDEQVVNFERDEAWYEEDQEQGKSGLVVEKFLHAMNNMPVAG